MLQGQETSSRLTPVHLLKPACSRLGTLLWQTLRSPVRGDMVPCPGMGTPLLQRATWPGSLTSRGKGSEEATWAPMVSWATGTRHRTSAHPSQRQFHIQPEPPRMSSVTTPLPRSKPPAHTARHLPTRSRDQSRNVGSTYHSCLRASKLLRRGSTQETSAQTRPLAG